MIPSAIVVLDALPLTMNGKLDTAALPTPNSASAIGAPSESSSNCEQVIAAIWSKALGRIDIGRDENFFDAGGDSLRLIAVHSELSRALTTSLTIADMFEYPTIASLAKHIGCDAPFNPSRESLDQRAAKQRDRLVRRRQTRTAS